MILMPNKGQKIDLIPILSTLGMGMRLTNQFYDILLEYIHLVVLFARGPLRLTVASGGGRESERQELAASDLSLAQPHVDGHHTVVLAELLQLVAPGEPELRGGREGGWREGGREGGWREGGREGGREGERESISRE